MGDSGVTQTRVKRVEKGGTSGVRRGLVGSELVGEPAWNPPGLTSSVSGSDVMTRNTVDRRGSPAAQLEAAGLPMAPAISPRARSR